MKWQVWHHQSLYPDKGHRRKMRIKHSRYGSVVVVECFSAVAFMQAHGSKVFWDHISHN